MILLIFIDPMTNEKLIRPDEQDAESPSSQPPQRRTFFSRKFSIRLVLILVTAFAIGAAIWGNTVSKTAYEQAMIERHWLDAFIVFDANVGREFEDQAYQPSWIQRSVGWWAGKHSVRRVVRMEIGSRENGEKRSEMPYSFFRRLETLNKREAPEELKKRWTSLSSLGSFAKLTHLQLRNARGLESLDEIGKLKQLRSLTIYEGYHLNNIDALQDLTELRSLTIDGGPDLSNADIFVGMKHLRRLALTDQDIGDASSLSHLTELRELRLRGDNKITDLSSFSSLTQLEELWLDDMPNLESLAGIERLPNLKMVGLSRCDKLHHLDTLPANLTKLRLWNCSDIQTLSDIPSTQLKEIYCGQCNGLLAPELPPSVNELTLLSLVGCQKIVSLEKLGSHSVKALEIYDAASLESLNGIASLQGLEVIKIRECQSLVDVSSLSNASERLRIAEIRDCKALQMIESVRRKAPLSQFTVEQCPNLVGIRDCYFERIEDLYIGNCNSFRSIELGGNLSGGLRISKCPLFVKIAATSDGLSLAHLKVYQSNGLTDFSKFQSLEVEQLSVGRCTQLLTLDGIEKIDGLKSVSFEGCSVLIDIGSLLRAPALEKYSFTNSPVSSRQETMLNVILTPMEEYTEDSSTVK